MSKELFMICIVCERDVAEADVADSIRPGDWVICRECDKITPDRRQAGQHWIKRSIWRSAQTTRLKRFEEATRLAFAYLSSYLGDDDLALTDEEQAMMKTLKEALAWVQP
jgi:hypothetical protein